MKKWTNVEIVELDLSETNHWGWNIPWNFDWNGNWSNGCCCHKEKKEEEKKREVVDLRS